MTLYEILDNLMYFIGPVVITVILIYWIYIENIKKRISEYNRKDNWNYMYIIGTYNR